MGRRASLSIHGPEPPDRTAELIHYAIGDSPRLSESAATYTSTAGPEDHSCPPPVTGAVAVRYLGEVDVR